MLEYIQKEGTTFLAILVVFIAVALMEMAAARKGKQVALKDRLLNVSAGAVFLIIGGYMAASLAAYVMQFQIFKVNTLDPIVYMLLFVLIQDFIYYFYHRLQHSWSWLWGIHKLHHTDTDVNITTSHRTHILEQPIQLILVVVIPILFLGIQPTGLQYAIYFAMFFLYFGHSKLNLDLGPLSHIFVGPRFHRVHHSLHPDELNRNFAQYFSFLDRIFGTYSAPVPISEVDTGVEGCSSTKQQWTPIIWPISALKFVGTK